MLYNILHPCESGEYHKTLEKPKLFIRSSAKIVAWRKCRVRKPGLDNKQGKMASQKYLTLPMMSLFIILISTLAPFSTDMYLSSLPQMVVGFDTTEAVLNMSLYGYFAALAVSILTLGPLSEKYGRKPVLVTCLLIYITMSLLCSFMDNIWLFIAVRMLQAIGGGGALVVTTAIIKDNFTGKILATVLTVTSAIGIIGPMAAPVIGAFLAGLFNWHATFWFTCLLGLICLGFAAAFTESLPKEKRYTGTITGSLSRLRVVAKNHSFILFLGVISMFTLPYMAFLSVSSYIYQDYFGLSGTTYSMVLATNVLMGLIGMLLLQRISQRVGNRRMMVPYLLIGVTSGILMVLFAHLHPLYCLICFIPCAAVNFTMRPFGFNILLSQKQGDGGAESSFLNAAVFVVGAIGMVIGTLPWPDFITGLSVCILIASAGYAGLWGFLVSRGVGLKGLEA